MKVSELTGALLDSWVARADPSREGIRWERQGEDWIGFGRIGSSPEFTCWIVTNASSLHDRATLQDKHLGARFYQPSKDWAQGGPIIERERIGLMPVLHDGETCWMAAHPGFGSGYPGPTPLVAAMRVYVISKFGDHVAEVAAE